MAKLERVGILIMRLFIGVWLSSVMQEEVVGYINRARQESCGLKWTAPANLHFTLKFLGETSANRLNDLKLALKMAAAQSESFRLQLGTVGCFPPLGVPVVRIIWLGVSCGETELVRLATKVENCCLERGFAENNKPFQPHLTIARAGNKGSNLRLTLPEIHFRSETETRINSFSLIESRLSSTGPEYQTLESFDFPG
jgi:2'-5' RNA ligase